MKSEGEVERAEGRTLQEVNEQEQQQGCVHRTHELELKLKENFPRTWLTHPLLQKGKLRPEKSSFPPKATPG